MTFLVILYKQSASVYEVQINLNVTKVISMETGQRLVDMLMMMSVITGEQKLLLLCGKNNNRRSPP